MVKLNLKNILLHKNLLSQCCIAKVGLHLKKMYYVCLKCKKKCLIKRKNI